MLLLLLLLVVPTEGVGVESGEVISPNYPASYPDNLDMTITLAGPPGAKLSIEFNDLDIEYIKDCSYDFLRLVDGDGSELLGRTCGTEVPGALVSGSHEVRVSFHSDGSEGRRGWNMTWTKGGWQSRHCLLDSARPRLSRISESVVTPVWPQIEI